MPDPDQREYLPLASLSPYARNARTHSPAQITQLVASIKEFGFTNPVLIDAQGGIIAGHGRVLAAQQVGMVTVPCLRLGHLTETQKRAYIIADNKLALNAGWDMELLAQEMAALAADAFDTGLMGFEDDEIAELLAQAERLGQPENSQDPDEVPEVDAIAISQPGDIWLLGKHRLMCGDATQGDDVAKLMDGHLARLCFTSPPYGQQRDYQDGATAQVQEWDKLMQGVFGNLPMDEYGQVLVNLGPIHRDGEWDPYWENWISWMRSEGWKRFGWYVWDQGGGLPGKFGGRFAPSHEFVFHFNRQDASNPSHPAQSYWTGLYAPSHTFVVHLNKKPRDPKKFKEKLPDSIHMGPSKGMRNKQGVLQKRTAPEASLQTHKIPDSVIRVNRSSSALFAKEHPASFPVALPTEFISAWPGLVYEPFSGSGTTIMAGEQTLRPVFAMEISPGYVDLAVRRWQTFTGQTARHAVTGRPFPG